MTGISISTTNSGSVSNTPNSQKMPQILVLKQYLKDVVTLAGSDLTVRAPAMCLPILTVHAEISVTPQDERFVKLGSEKRGGGQRTAFPV